MKNLESIIPLLAFQSQKFFQIHLDDEIFVFTMYSSIEANPHFSELVKTSPISPRPAEATSLALLMELPKVEGKMVLPSSSSGIQPPQEFPAQQLRRRNKPKTPTEARPTRTEPGSGICEN